MIARPALAAVTEALAGVTDPGEAVEILVARDMWPMEDAPAPELFTDVDTLAAVASLGIGTLATVSALLREAIAEVSPAQCVLAWSTRQQLLPLDTDQMADRVERIGAAPRAVVTILRMGIVVQWVHMRTAAKSTLRYAMSDGTECSVDLGGGPGKVLATLLVPPI